MIEFLAALSGKSPCCAAVGALDSLACAADCTAALVELACKALARRRLWEARKLAPVKAAAFGARIF